MAKRVFLKIAQGIEVVTGVGFGIIFGRAALRVPGFLGEQFVAVMIALMVSSGTMVAICAYLFWKTRLMLKSDMH